MKYHQPQIRQAIISRIHTNGVSLLIPFFDMRFVVPFFDKEGHLVDWMKEWTSSENVKSEVILENGKELVDHETTSTIIAFVLKDENNRECCRFQLYDSVSACLTVEESNVETHSLIIHATIIKGLVAEGPESEGGIYKMPKQIEDYEMEKRDLYHKLENTDDLQLVESRELIADQVEKVKSR